MMVAVGAINPSGAPLRKRYDSLSSSCSRGKVACDNMKEFAWPRKIVLHGPDG